MTSQRSFLNITATGLDRIHSILDRAKQFQVADKENSLQDILPKLEKPTVAVMVFSEPSTRTRVSFELAARRLGISSVFVYVKDNSSALKGEVWEETLLNIGIMKPDILIFRCDEWEKDSLSEVLDKVPCPLVNAGNGKTSHPTQALVDMFVLEQSFGREGIKGKNILFTGDVYYSRVARSIHGICKMTGMNVGTCAPEKLAPKAGDEYWSGSKSWSNLDEALEWADVCVLLRSQIERHDFNLFSSFSVAEYRSHFCLTESRANLLKKESVILHPGPFIEGVDLDRAILKHPSCKIRKQVECAVFIRMAILCDILGI